MPALALRYIFHDRPTKALYKDSLLWQIEFRIEVSIEKMNLSTLKTIAINIIIRAHSPGG